MSEKPETGPTPDRELLDQLEALDLDPERPLVISDADEVLFAFMASFERHLLSHGLYFDWSSFALTGNVRRQADDRPVPEEEVKSSLEEFFRLRTGDIEPVPHAADSLASLVQAGAQVVVLSNIPRDQRQTRLRTLARHGMDYPLIANAGSKGPAVGWLAGAMRAPIAFLDDLPHHHAAVANAAETVLRVHFVADPRLAKLLGPAEHSHHRTGHWPEARDIIARHFRSGET